MRCQRGNQAGINTCWYPFSFSPLVPFPSHHTNHTDKLNLTPIFYLGKPLFPLSVAVRLIYVIQPYSILALISVLTLHFALSTWTGNKFLKAVMKQVKASIYSTYHAFPTCDMFHMHTSTGVQNAVCCLYWVTRSVQTNNEKIVHPLGMASTR